MYRRSAISALALIAALSAARAETLEERVQLCNACHGENGIPQDKSVPVIWGQHQGYTYLQLRDYKRGDRQSDQMQPVAEALERNEMMALAEYFANKPWPRLGQPAAPDAVASPQGARMSRSGAPGAISASIRAPGPSRGSPARAGATWSRRCSTSATESAATIPACPTS